METSIPAQASQPYTRVASPMHTIVVLAVVGLWAFSFQLFAPRFSTAAHPSRALLYVITAAAEWLIFALVVTGVRRSERSLIVVLGNQWRSVRQLLRDIGIALGFWLVALIVLGIVGRLLQITASNRILQSIIPRGGLEVAIWIGLSISAGICEEAFFRGYLQAQFMAATKNAPVAIVLSGAIFGAAHAYQGLRRVIVISVYGVMFGIVAHWRRSVRPGMITHAWHDCVSGIAGSLMRH